MILKFRKSTEQILVTELGSSLHICAKTWREMDGSTSVYQTTDHSPHTRCPNTRSLDPQKMNAPTAVHELRYATVKSCCFIHNRMHESFSSNFLANELASLEPCANFVSLSSPYCYLVKYILSSAGVVALYSLALLEVRGISTVCFRNS